MKPLPFRLGVREVPSTRKWVTVDADGLQVVVIPVFDGGDTVGRAA